MMASLQCAVIPQNRRPPAVDPLFQATVLGADNRGIRPHQIKSGRHVENDFSIFDMLRHPTIIERREVGAEIHNSGYSIDVDRIETGKVGGKTPVERVHDFLPAEVLHPRLGNSGSWSSIRNQCDSNNLSQFHTVPLFEGLTFPGVAL